MATAPEERQVHRFTELYRAHLAQGAEATQAWQRFVQQQEIYQSQWRNFYEALQQKLREQFHAEQASQRRSRLASVLAQTPPFTLSDDDVRIGKSRQGQRKRYSQFEQFIRRYATRQSVGVHPFFASLKRVLEYQGSGNVERACQWLFDDAVLMETGPDDWVESAVWILKGVLQFEEKGRSADDPFLTDEESIRSWTLSTWISDPEYRRLARLIPSYVLPRRGRGSDSLERTIHDEESLKQIELPTGVMHPSDTLRDSDYRGGLLERLLSWLFTSWY